jgi:uncharacterized protein (DUF305 family)
MNVRRIISPRSLWRASFAAMLFAAAAASQADPGPEESFLAENAMAMNSMTANMMVKPSGDIDKDFVHMMVPHHRGAVEMAQAELRYGHNEQLRRIAQEIIVDQLQEIAAMRLAIGEATTAPDEGTHPAGAMGGMDMKNGEISMPKEP